MEIRKLDIARRARMVGLNGLGREQGLKFVELLDYHGFVSSKASSVSSFITRVFRSAKCINVAAFMDFEVHISFLAAAPKLCCPQLVAETVVLADSQALNCSHSIGKLSGVDCKVFLDRVT
jgi:hypothetical protein